MATATAVSSPAAASAATTTTAAAATAASAATTAAGTTSADGSADHLDAAASGAGPTSSANSARSNDPCPVAANGPNSASSVHTEDPQTTPADTSEAAAVTTAAPSASTSCPADGTAAATASGNQRPAPSWTDTSAVATTAERTAADRGDQSAAACPVETAGVGSATAESPPTTAAARSSTSELLVAPNQAAGATAATTWIPQPAEAAIPVPPDLFLLGCIFLMVDYDRTNAKDLASWHHIIAESGGEVEATYSHRVTHVLCETQKSLTVQQALRDGKRCITAYWLNDVVLKQQVLPPWQALHFPTPFGDDNRPCKNCVFSYSGFEGEERARVGFMIETVGAKLTKYFTQHSHVLICRQPDGAKYKKAREWNKPVVNLQWLNEILFGHLGCIQTPEMPKYQQFNLGNPFRIEYGLIPSLMAAWRMPINITQESYDKIKASPPPRRAKRPRLEKNMPSCDSDQENKLLEEVEVTNLEPPPEDKRPVIIFSGVEDMELAKKARQLGCKVTTDKKEATHLVMPKMQRTIKMICRHIMSTQWILDSHSQNRILDEQPYALSDPEFDKMFGCTISKVLEKPNRREFFKDKVFYLTPSIIPAPKALQEVIECAGGTVEQHRRPLKQITEMNKTELKYIVITHEKDFHLLGDIISSPVGDAIDPTLQR